MERKLYIATELAGPFVAGRRHRGEPLLLTDAEAEHELRIEVIRPVPQEKPAPEMRKARKAE